MSTHPRHPHPAPTPSPGHGTTILGHQLPAHQLVIAGWSVPPAFQYATLFVAFVVMAYCVATSGRFIGSLKRLGICAAAAASATGIFVLWANHARHGQLAAHADKLGGPLAAELANSWLLLSVTATVVLFAVATWIVRRRRSGGFRRRRRGGGGAFPAGFTGGYPGGLS